MQTVIMINPVLLYCPGHSLIPESLRGRSSSFMLLDRVWVTSRDGWFLSIDWSVFALKDSSVSVGFCCLTLAYSLHTDFKLICSLFWRYLTFAMFLNLGLSTVCQRILCYGPGITFLPSFPTGLFNFYLSVCIYKNHLCRLLLCACVI